MSEYKLIDFNQVAKADIIFTTLTTLIHKTLNYSKLFLISLTIFLLIFCGSCSSIYRSGFIPVPKQIVSDSVVIGSDWVEIVPPSPLKPYGTSPFLVIRFHGINKKSYSDDSNKGEILNLADGRKTKIEAFLYDDKGESYELQITGTGGVGGGFDMSRKFISNITNGKMEYEVPDFPDDRTYTKLKIRSEIPLQCEKIEWSGTNPK